MRHAEWIVKVSLAVFFMPLTHIWNANVTKSLLNYCHIAIGLHDYAITLQESYPQAFAIFIFCSTGLSCTDYVSPCIMCVFHAQCVRVESPVHVSAISKFFMDMQPTCRYISVSNYIYRAYTHDTYHIHPSLCIPTHTHPLREVLLMG